MSILPRKHPTGGQKLKKSNRVYPSYSLWERLKNRKRAKPKKTWFGGQGKASQGQAVQAQPQRGWTAQPAQNPAPQQNQQLPVPSWWRAIVLIIIVILVLIVVYHFILTLMPTLGQGNVGGDGGSGCLTTCEGSGIVIAPNCNCPPGSTYYNTITNPPSMSGYKQCICG